MPAFQPYRGKPAVRMIGGIEETSASYEARSAPRSYPTGRGANAFGKGFLKPTSVKSAAKTFLHVNCFTAGWPILC
jgi:hypothetical protein